MNKYIYIILISLLLVSAIINISLLKKEDSLGVARDRYLPGIYNATPPTIEDGTGTALNTDENGNVKIKL